MNVDINYINKRYSKANNKYCSDNDNEKLKTYITYLDINNLFEYAMSRYLPYANFKWVKNMDEIEQKLRKIKNNSSTRYVLEVDLEYPKNLHYEYSDYLLAPQKINIQKEWLSDYCLEIVHEHNVIVASIKKLTPNLMRKNNYVIHYRNLKQCLEKELILTSVNGILKFKQKN